MMKQSNGCLTTAPRSSAVKQWTERTGTNDEEEALCHYINEFGCFRQSLIFDNLVHRTD